MIKRTIGLLALSFLLFLISCDSGENKTAVKPKEEMEHGMKMDHGMKMPEKRSLKSPIDFTLTDHDGNALEIETLRGMPLMVVFFYTTCPDPKMCSLTVQRAIMVQKEIDKRAQGKARFVYITIDSQLDTPEVLKGYAEKNGIDLSTGLLLTGEAQKLKEVALGQFRFGYEDKKGKTIGHQMVSYIVDKQGIIDDYIHWSDWSHQNIVEDMERLIRN